jgi:hypothetical protein
MRLGAELMHPGRPIDLVVQPLFLDRASSNSGSMKSGAPRREASFRLRRLKDNSNGSAMDVFG